VALGLPACQGGGVDPGPEPGPAAAISIEDGSGQRGPVGRPLARAIVARVTDAEGRGVAGVVVAFAASGGSGSLAPATALTDETGEASAVWTLGTRAGAMSADAAVQGLLPAAVTATAVPGAPAQLEFAAVPQVAVAGMAFDPAVAVAIVDEYGNRVDAGSAQVSLALNRGQLGGQTSVTAVEGLASFPGLHIDETGTDYVLTATSEGLAPLESGTVVVESPGVAAVVVTPDRAGLLVDQAVDLEPAALDGLGNAVPDATISWSSSDPDVARVSAAGRVTAVSPGSAMVTATSGEWSGTAEVTVSLNGGTLTDVTYCTMNDVAVRMDVYIPDASKPRPLPVAVHVHGGGWTGGSKSSGARFAQLMPLLLERGYLVASLDYRHAPTHRYPAQIQDVKCAIRHLRARASRYGLDPDRVGAWGGSAGGQLVSLLGTADASAGFDEVGGFQGQSSEVRAVAAISAITDFSHPDELLDDYSRAFRTWPDPTSPEMIEASPVTHVSAGDPPFFLIAGEDDELVLPAQSQRMHRMLLDAGVASTLLIVRNADHDLQPTDGPIEPSASVINSRMADFFDQHLR
jgi:acetyl esterase/lipase